MLKAPFDVRVPEPRPRRDGGEIRPEDFGAWGPATLEGRFGRIFRSLSGDETALAAVIAGLPALQRSGARIALIREVGGGQAAEIFERAFGSREVGLPPVGTDAGHPADPAGEARCYEAARRQALCEVILVAARERWPERGAIVEDLLAGAEPRLARGALTRLKDQHEHGSSLFQTLDRDASDAVSRADRRTLLAGSRGVARTQSGSPLGGALRPVAERRAVSIFRQATSPGRVRADNPAVDEALRVRGGGEPLPEWLRARFEGRLGVSLSAVRIHADATAARAAMAISARAFTVGEDIFFAAGAFAPETRAGEALLLHELAHVRQAVQGRIPQAAGGPEVSQPGDAVEREAEAIAGSPIHSDAQQVAKRPVRPGLVRGGPPAAAPPPRPGAFPILRNATDAAALNDVINDAAKRSDTAALNEIGTAIDSAAANTPAGSEGQVSVNGTTYNLTNDELLKARDAVNNGLKNPGGAQPGGGAQGNQQQPGGSGTDKIIAKAVESRAMKNGEKLWILETPYWAQLYGAMTQKERNAQLPPGTGGTPNSGSPGYLFQYVRPAYVDGGSVPDALGAPMQPGGTRSKGVVKLTDGAYYLSRYVMHPQSNNKKGQEIRRADGFKAVEVYKIPGDLYDRVESGQKASRKATGGDVREGAREALAKAAAMSGHVLPEALRRRFEAALGADLGAVRVHTGDESDRAAAAISARAYTVGQHIYFARGEFDPDSQAGQELLAHEVVHTLQQGSGTASAGLEVSQPGDALEVEADRVAHAITVAASGPAMAASGPIAAHPAEWNRGGQGSIQRTPEPDEANAKKLRDDYDNAMAANPRDYNLIGKLLNGFAEPELLEKLKNLDRDTIAKIHEGALASVGPDSNGAKFTRPYYNDKKIEENIARGDWQEVARFMNGFNEPDMIARIRKLDPEQLQQLKAGAAKYDAVLKNIDKAAQPDAAQAPAAKDAPPVESGLKKPRNRQEMIQVYGQPGTNLAVFDLRSGPNGKIEKRACHKKVGPLFQAVLDKIHADGKSDHIKYCAGVFKEDAGAHAWGVAIDLNPQGNYGSSPAPDDKTKQVPNVSEDQAIIAPYFLAAGFVWGKEFKNPRPDAMHFQYCEPGAENP